MFGFGIIRSFTRSYRRVLVHRLLDLMACGRQYRCPTPVLGNAKLRASERGITLSEFVSEAVVCHLNARFNSPKDAPPFRLITVGGGTVNPNIDLNRTSAIID